jgi:hypothetical protein
MLAGLFSAAPWFIAFNVYQEIQWLPRAQVNDFHYFYAAAKAGLAGGWSRIYDPALSQQIISSECPGSPTLAFLYPPIDAWLALPLTALPCMTAYWIWAWLSIAMLIAAAFLAAPRGWEMKVLFALSALAFLPTYTAFAAGQLSPLVLLALVLAWRSMAAGREIVAGILLAILLVKPQLALLVPIALLVAGHQRAFLAWAVTTTVLIVASVLSLGQHGIEQWVANQIVLYWASGYEQRWSLPVILGGRAAGYGAELVAFALSLVVARRTRQLGPDAAFAIAVAASMLLAYHLTPPDFVVLLMPLWLIARTERPEAVALAVVGWIACWFSVGLAVPVMLFEWLAIVFWLALRPAPGHVQTEIPVSPLINS